MPTTRSPRSPRGPTVRSPRTPTPPEHKGFILAEDDALKQLLEATLTAPDSGGTEKPVRVWYRFPDPEVQVTYPYCTIDLIGIEPAYDLWHSLYYLLPNSEIEENSDSGQVSGHRLYDPSTSPQTDYGDGSLFFERMNFLPYRLFYQLSLWANNAFHDRLLSARMFRDIVHPHSSWLFCPADGAWKRMETLSWTPADLPSQEGASKRIFRKLFTISVQTDMPQDRLASLMLEPKIQKLLLRMSDRDTGTYFTPDKTTDYWETIHPPWPPAPA